MEFFEGLGKLIEDHWWEIMLAGFVLRTLFSRYRRGEDDDDDDDDFDWDDN